MNKLKKKFDYKEKTENILHGFSCFVYIKTIFFFMYRMCEKFPILFLVQLIK
jgi:hypothetical protein